MTLFVTKADWNLETEHIYLAFQQYTLYLVNQINILFTIILVDTYTNCYKRAFDSGVADDASTSENEPVCTPKRRYYNYKAIVMPDY